MEIVMGVMIIIMLVGFSIFGHHRGMMEDHDKGCPKQGQIIKHDGHEKDDCKKTMDIQENRNTDKDNTNSEEIKK